MTDEISYFDVAAFLAEIEPDYERYLDLMLARGYELAPVPEQ